MAAGRASRRPVLQIFPRKVIVCTNPARGCTLAPGRGDLRHAVCATPLLTFAKEIEPMTMRLHALSLRKLLSATVAAGFLFSFGANAQAQPKPATEATKAANAQLMHALPFNDKTSFELAHKGFIAPLPQETIKGPNGTLIWDPAKYAFVKEGQAAPDTVNPSLWRQSQLINISGL